MKTSRLLLCFTFLALVAPAVRAGTNGFFVPFFRGSSNSQAGYWETFSVPVGAPGNLPDKPGATTGAVLTQSETNAFLTGSGNIYNLSGLSSFTVAETSPFAIGTVVLQARALGAELDDSSVLLSYTNESGAHTLAPLARNELDRGSQPGLGATVSWLWQWNLSGLNVRNYSLSFIAAGPSLSFDSMTLDTWNQFVPLFTTPYQVNDATPAIERWMYANNAAPCDRPAGSTFGTLASDSGVDTRHAQQLIGWDTAAWIPTNQAPARYLIRRCRATLTINRGELFTYDPTQDDYRTFFDTNHPAFLPDADAGRPIEVFGAGFRNGFDAASFDQCALFGANAPGQRNAFAAGWSTNGVLVDVSNNAGKNDDAFPRFEVAPFAIGQTMNATPGELVPAGAKITFDLNLADPFVLAYVQDALNTGRLRLMVTSLHVTDGQFGTPSYPDFVTHFNEAVIGPTRLEMEGVVMSNADVDTDGLPDDWEIFNFSSLTHSGASDPDNDGASNLAELRAGTDPLRSASVLQVWLARNERGRVALRFAHAASRQYFVEFTEDLQTWSTLKNPPVFDLAAGLAEWTDDAPPDSQRFYRLRAASSLP